MDPSGACRIITLPPPSSSWDPREMSGRCCGSVWQWSQPCANVVRSHIFPWGLKQSPNTIINNLYNAPTQVRFVELWHFEMDCLCTVNENVYRTLFWIADLIRFFQLPLYPCSPSLLYFRHLMAFVFAIEEINNNTAILPNITLGFQIYDSSDSADVALERLLRIMYGRLDKKIVPNYSCRRRGTIMAIIGHLLSSSTYSIAGLAGIYKYPQVGSGTTLDNCTEEITIHNDWLEDCEFNVGGISVVNMWWRIIEIVNWKRWITGDIENTQTLLPCVSYSFPSAVLSAVLFC